MRHVSIFMALVFVARMAAPAAMAAPSQPVVGTVGVAIAGPTARQAGQSPRVLKPGAEIMFKDRISTKRGSSTQIAFVDRSTLSIGENSDVVIDSFVYHIKDDGTMRVKLARGLLHFIGGEISHQGGASIVTPTVTIGIRGGIGTVASLDDTPLLHDLPGVPAGFRGGTIVVNGYGTLTVRNHVSEQILPRPGLAVFVGSDQTEIKPPVQIDPAVLEGVLAHMTAEPRTALRTPYGRNTNPQRTAATFRPSSNARGLNALDFISVFSVGNSFARNRSQSRITAQLQAQLVASLPSRLQASPAGPTQNAPSQNTSSPSSSGNPGPTQNASSQNTSPPSSPGNPGPTQNAPSQNTSSPSTPRNPGPTQNPPSRTKSPPSQNPISSNANAPATKPSTNPIPILSVIPPTILLTLTGQLSFHDITTSTITAHVIYAHDIHAANIQAGQIIYGGGYGNGNGNSNANTTNVQASEIDAHDISATTITADIVYAHSISP